MPLVPHYGALVCSTQQDERRNAILVGFYHQQIDMQAYMLGILPSASWYLLTTMLQVPPSHPIPEHWFHSWNTRKTWISFLVQYFLYQTKHRQCSDKRVNIIWNYPNKKVTANSNGCVNVGQLRDWLVVLNHQENPLRWVSFLRRFMVCDSLTSHHSGLLDKNNLI